MVFFYYCLIICLLITSFESHYSTKSLIWVSIFFMRVFQLYIYKGHTIIWSLNYTAILAFLSSTRRPWNKYCTSRQSRRKLTFDISTNNTWTPLGQPFWFFLNRKSESILSLNHGYIFLINPLTFLVLYFSAFFKFLYGIFLNQLSTFWQGLYFSN